MLLTFPSIPAEAPPLVWRWRALDDPLPRRRMLSLRQDRAIAQNVACPPWLTTGATDQPFDFSDHVSRLAADIAARCPEFAHLRVERILLGVLQARNERRHGLQARVTPLRFAGGQLMRLRFGVPYQVQRYFLDDHEFLYLMTFCLPRFLDQEFDDKLITIFHELYHISPQFNGDLRRHDGRYQLHTHNQRHYDRRMADLARSYLAGKPDPAYHDFLRLNFAQLEQRHGAILGIVVPRAKIIPMIPGTGQCHQAPPAADHPQGSP